MIRNVHDIVFQRNTSTSLMLGLVAYSRALSHACAPTLKPLGAAAGREGVRGGEAAAVCWVWVYLKEKGFRPRARPSRNRRNSPSAGG